MLIKILRICGLTKCELQPHIRAIAICLIYFSRSVVHSNWVWPLKVVDSSRRKFSSRYRNRALLGSSCSLQVGVHTLKIPSNELLMSFSKEGFVDIVSLWPRCWFESHSTRVQEEPKRLETSSVGNFQCYSNSTFQSCAFCPVHNARCIQLGISTVHSERSCKKLLQNLLIAPTLRGIFLEDGDSPLENPLSPLKIPPSSSWSTKVNNVTLLSLWSVWKMLRECTAADQR